MKTVINLSKPPAVGKSLIFFSFFLQLLQLLPRSSQADAHLALEQLICLTTHNFSFTLFEFLHFLEKFNLPKVRQMTLLGSQY